MNVSVEVLFASVCFSSFAKDISVDVARLPKRKGGNSKKVM